MNTIRLMIADNHVMVREGLKCLLETEEHFKVIAEANNGEECLQLLFEQKPDILLLNFNMPDKKEFELLQKINENKTKKVKVLVIVCHNEIDYLVKAVTIGIDGYILKNSDSHELKKAILSIMDGNMYNMQKISDELKWKMQNIKNDLVKVNYLTKRELDVLKHLSVGMYNKEIALKLSISERTVKNHVSNILKKIGVADRTQAAVFAIKNRLIDIYN